MKSTDVFEIVREARVDPTYFSIGDERHEALCLLQEGGRWRVFLSERGRRHEEHDFESEDAACVYFLRRIFELWQPR